MRLGSSIAAAGAGAAMLSLLIGCAPMKAEAPRPQPMAQSSPVPAAGSQVPVILPQPAGTVEPSPYVPQPYSRAEPPVASEQVDSARVNWRGAAAVGDARSDEEALGAAAQPSTARPVLVPRPAGNAADPEIVARRAATGTIIPAPDDPSAQIVRRIAPQELPAVRGEAPPPPQGDFQLGAPNAVQNPGQTPTPGAPSAQTR